MKDNVVRYNENIKNGLNSTQVQERIKQGLVNYDTSPTTKSIKRILIDNTFTLFNLLNVILAFFVIFVGSYKNVLFMGVVICNTAISIYQEIHSKKIVDKLSLLSETKVKVIRDKKEQYIHINELVLDDIIVLESGNQIVADAVIIEGQIDVNESFITGEAEPILKTEEQLILSGSFVVSGNCIARVEHVGQDNYTSKISSGAKYIKKVKSELMTSLNKIIRFISIVIIPLGILLFMHQLNINGNIFKDAVISTVGALIGMIPEGLVLLVSTVLAVSVVRISKHNVLVQELFCIETLARVDTLCLDKTGTITEGCMEVVDILPVGTEKNELEKILGNIAYASKDNNATIDAIREKYKTCDKLDIKETIPFSSSKKWSGVCFSNEGSYVIGAPEFVLKENVKEYLNIYEKYLEENRVIVIAQSDNEFNNKELPENMKVLGFVLIRDRIRVDAPEILGYFKEQGVGIKVISGDNPITVSSIAKRAGLDEYDKYIDMSSIKTDEEITEVVDKYSIFGRVTPEQKQKLIQALKSKGHTVAMTGDGVNDVLALKEADCSIAVASGSDAARNVSQLVLLDSNFKSMPNVVAEGRRTINNIQRSATLFLNKTIFSAILAFIFLFISNEYPFMPVQLTVLSAITIGIPSFVLALEPNKEIVKGRFIRNVLKNSLPSAITIVLTILTTTLLANILNIGEIEYSSICLLATATVGFLLLKKLCKPFNGIRRILFFAMLILFILSIVFLKDIISFKIINLIICIVTEILAVSMFYLSYYLINKINIKKQSA